MKSLITRYAKIDVFFNNIKMDLYISKLENESRYFRVDERYKLCILLPNVSEKSELVCRVIIRNAEKSRVIDETGEDYYDVSYYFGKSKMCIGTIGDLPNLSYDFTNNQIKIFGMFTKDKFVFYLSYVSVCDEQSELSAWLAADPTL